MGGVATICELSKVIYPGPVGGSFLEVMATQMYVAPDIDRDGDGLEQLEHDGVSITACVDGDGTVIRDPECFCDPRIQDGYSVALTGTAVRGYLVGVEE
jgi:hypothetical protein